MNFTELVAEFQARGHMQDDATRAGVYINAARAMLDSARDWPYLEASVTGVAPLTVTDLKTAEAVTNETQDYALAAGDFRSLLEDFGDLSLTGLPAYFYIASDPPVVATYPTNTDTIGVQYYRVTPDIAGTTAPACPARYHSLIVDMAVVRAYLDRDNLDAARALQAFVDARMVQMVDDLMGGRQIAGAQLRQQITYGSADW